MNRLVVILLIFSFFAVESCSPVRSGRGKQKKVTSRKSLEKERKPRKSNLNKARFSDTTVVELPPIYSGSGASLAYDFDQAIKEFDASEFASACEKIRFFAGTFAEGDSLYYESMFYLSECEIVDNNVHKSKNILSDLLDEEGCPDSIHERCLIRLGQVYCVLGDEAKAKEYFQRLITRFPNSIYISIANCESIK